MEFPGLGKHCSEGSCKQLDFLPMKCDACSEIFCKDHIHYMQHNCQSSYKKDVQVPICPLCNIPIPVAKGELPDIKVGEHIDRDCMSDPAKEKRKIFTNKCSMKKCKQKELIPFHCEKCRMNFCLKHRHERDHYCKGFQGSGRGISVAGAAAVNRIEESKKNISSQNTHSKPSLISDIGNKENKLLSLQAGLSEEEALAQAVELSMPSSLSTVSTPDKELQEREDLALAQAIAASEAEHERQLHRRQSDKSSCCVS